MDFVEFTSSLNAGTAPPSNLSPYLKALWFAGNHQWDQAHEIAQNIHDTNGSWIHAYLHREEEDLSNADYWYARSNRTRPSISLKEEWETIVKSLL